MRRKVKISSYVSGLLEVGMALVLRELQQRQWEEGDDLPENGDAAVFDAQRSIANHLCQLVSGGERTLTVRDPLDLGLLVRAIEVVRELLPCTVGGDELKEFRATLLRVDDE